MSRVFYVTSRTVPTVTSHKKNSPKAALLKCDLSIKHREEF